MWERPVEKPVHPCGRLSGSPAPDDRRRDSERVRTAIRDLDWVVDAEVRLRVSGHILAGEAFVIPTTVVDLPRRAEDAITHIRSLDWRLQIFSITPVVTLDRASS